MNTLELINSCFQEDKEFVEKFWEGRTPEVNPALAIYAKMELRPYTKEDFQRKEFHMNLIGEE